jgi:dTDP-4-dehydrorhamnose reductase/UDP-glucose 4-epimerase
MSGATLLVIGGGSVLAREFAARNPDLPLRVVGHAAADRADAYEGIACAVNFAFAPALHHTEYDAALDLDLRAARRVADAGGHYVMVSSRRVYGAEAQWNAAEDAALLGLDAYGRNKLRIERHLAALLGDRLTVLRPGNVVGYEPLAGRRRFAAYLQNQLAATGRIRLSISPRVRRDLVPAGFFSRALREVMLRRPPGAFNVGAGYATTAGDAARWLVEGYGAGEVVAESDRVEDEFLLDTQKLRRDLGLACETGEVERALREAGRRLATENPGHARRA